MAITPEEREVLIRIDERVKTMKEAMTTSEGDMRCTTHEQQLKTLFKKVDSATKWIKGVAATLVAGGLLTILSAIVAHLAK
jgi:cell division protein FtsX